MPLHRERHEEIADNFILADDAATKRVRQAAGNAQAPREQFHVSVGDNVVGAIVDFILFFSDALHY